MFCICQFSPVACEQHAGSGQRQFGLAILETFPKGLTDFMSRYVLHMRLNQRHHASYSQQDVKDLSKSKSKTKTNHITFEGSVAEYTSAFKACLSDSFTGQFTEACGARRSPEATKPQRRGGGGGGGSDVVIEFNSWQQIECLQCCCDFAH